MARIVLSPKDTMTPPASPLPTRLRAILFACVASTAAFTACGTSSDGGANCSNDRCDEGAPTLVDRNDPVAQYFKTVPMTDDGLMDITYQDALFGVSDLMGCPATSIAVFTVSDTLIGEEPFPRLVSVACKDDDAKASEFFMAASFEDTETGDVDVRDVELFAWDKTTRQYNFYAFAPSEDDDEMVQLEIEPERCRECHLTPADTSHEGMRMTPIMNELNRPWTHWNAEPGFPSHNFSVPEGMDEQPNYAELALGWKAPAQRLEEIIRFGGHAKVAAARVRDRRNAPNLTDIMGLMRPVFCNEQINYVSEDHDSGILFNSAYVDPGIRSMFIQIRPNDWPWEWLNDEVVRLGSPAGDETVVQIPVRGNSDVSVETSLVTTRVLTPYQILRARALDSEHPVFSEFRCNLWKDAYARYRTSPPDFGDATRSMHVMSDIFEDIMTLDGKPIVGASPETLVMMPNADDASVTRLSAALGENKVADGSCETDGYCVGDVDAFGAHLQERLDEHISAGRDELRGIRTERICHVFEGVASHENDRRFPEGSTRFPNAPALPEVNCE